MKVLSFPNGKKRFRFVVPARKSPTGKRRAYYFATKAEAQKKLLEFKRRGAAALADLQDMEIGGLTEQEAKRWQYLYEHFGFTPERIDREIEREVKKR